MHVGMWQVGYASYGLSLIHRICNNQAVLSSTPHHVVCQSLSAYLVLCCFSSTAAAPTTSKEYWCISSCDSQKWQQQQRMSTNHLSGCLHTIAFLLACIINDDVQSNWEWARGERGKQLHKLIVFTVVVVVVMVVPPAKVLKCQSIVRDVSVVWQLLN